MQTFVICSIMIGSTTAGAIVANPPYGKRLERPAELARDLAIAGVGAWFVARLLGALIVEDKSLSGGFDLVTRFGDSPAYPVVRLAVIVAVVCVASPYVTRTTRRFGQLLVVVMATAGWRLVQINRTTAGSLQPQLEEFVRRNPRPIIETSIVDGRPSVSVEGQWVPVVARDDE